VFCLLDSASGTDLSVCNCPPRCTNFVHEATVSSSRLSDMTIKYYLSQGNNKSEIGRRYVNAVGTRNRVASALLTDVIGQLQKLLTTYQRLRAVLDVDLIEHTTSLPGQILASVNTIVQKTQDSVEEFSSRIVHKFTEYYEQNVDFAVKRLLHSARDQLYFASIDVNDTDNFNASLIIEKMFHYVDAVCKNYKVVNASVHNGANFSTRLFVDRNCNDPPSYGCLHDEPAVIMSHGAQHIEYLADDYKSTARDILKCFPMYRTFLDEVQSWLKKALTIHSSLPLLSANRRYVLTELDNELNWLKDASHTFAEKTVVRSFVCACIVGLYKRLNWIMIIIDGHI